MKKIYLKESQIRMLEGKKWFVDTDKVLLVKKFLDKWFRRSGYEQFDDYKVKHNNTVVMVGSDGKDLKQMDEYELFMILVNKFDKIYSNESKRNRFLSRVMKDWYYGRISKEGLLSSNSF